MPNENIGKELIYLKTFTIRDIKDLIQVQKDINNYMILIIRITPLAQKNVDDLKTLIDELYKSIETVGGDIARLGEERIIITPPSVKIWHNDLERIKNSHE